MPRIGVVGAGAWGTALAVTAARAGHRVDLWGRDRSLIERVAASRENPAYLTDVTLPEAVRPTPTLADLAGTDMLLLAVPAQTLRRVVGSLPPSDGPLVITAKGLEQATGLRLSEVVLAERPGSAVAALSGPSFAPEVARGLPTAVTSPRPIRSSRDC